MSTTTARYRDAAGIHVRLPAAEIARAADPLPGAVRVSANRQTYLTDIPLLGQALREIAADPAGAGRYVLDERGDYVPRVRPRVPASV